MTDTPTPETPAELAAQIMRMADVLAYVHETTVRKNHHGPRCRTELHAAIYRLRDLATLAASSTAPAGFVLVPVEPTDAMVSATHGIDLSYMPDQWGADRAAVYRAMLAAAPAAAERKPLTAGELREPKNGSGWRVEWWNESARLMLPDDMKLDSFDAYRNGALVFRIKAAHGITAAPAGSEGKP